MNAPARPVLLRLSQIIGRRATKRKPAIPPLIPISATTWYEGVKSGRFPKPVRLGPKSVAWHAEDIRRIIEGEDGADKTIPAEEIQNREPCIPKISKMNIDWGEILVELQLHGVSIHGISKAIGVANRTVRDWRTKSPQFESGRRLVVLWTYVTGKPFSQVPER